MNSPEITWQLDHFSLLCLREVLLSAWSKITYPNTCIPVSGKGRIAPEEEHFISTCIPLARLCHMPTPSCIEGYKKKSLFSVSLIYCYITNNSKHNVLRVTYLLMNQLGSFWLHMVLTWLIVQLLSVDSWAGLEGTKGLTYLGIGAVNQCLSSQP